MLGWKGEVTGGTPVCRADRTAPSYRLLETTLPLHKQVFVYLHLRVCRLCQEGALGTATSLNTILAFSPLGCCVKACLGINVKMSLPWDACWCSFAFSVVEPLKEKGLKT